MNRMWSNFWFKKHYPDHVIYGRVMRSPKTFRWQRLMNVLLIITALLIIILK